MMTDAVVVMIHVSRLPAPPDRVGTIRHIDVHLEQARRITLHKLQPTEGWTAHSHRTLTNPTDRATR